MCKTGVWIQNIVKSISHNVKEYYINKKYISKGVKKMIVAGTTEKVGKFLKEKKINLTELSKNTGIPYNLLYASVGDKNRIRELRVNEFLSICEALGLSADVFTPECTDNPSSD